MTYRDPDAKVIELIFNQMTTIIQALQAEKLPASLNMIVKSVCHMYENREQLLKEAAVAQLVETDAITG